MSDVLIILLLALGILLIVKGGDWFVDAASWVAETLHVPQFIIGATVVSLATTLPEILVSTIAAAEGNADMAVGNAVGSVNANIGLIMAISMLCLPHLFKRSAYLAKSILLIGAIGLLFLLSMGGLLNAWLSLLLLALFVMFIVENILSLKRNTLLEKAQKFEKSKDEKTKPSKKEVLKNVAMFVLGAAGIVIGAQLLVTNGSAVAKLLGVPDSIIAVTLVAVATSLPELVTTIVAISKKKSELSVGNIIGANIIDITLILPLCAIISGGALPVALQSVRLDLPFCMLFAAVALLPALLKGKFMRWQGALMLTLYAGYIALLLLSIFGVVSIY